MDIQSLQQAVERYLEDSSDPAPLTHALRTLSTSREPATSLLLLSTIHHLLISLFAPTLDDGRSDRAQQLFSLFHVSLFPALLEDAQTPDGGLENQARLADTLLDVVWQIDQEVDSQAFELRQPGKVTDLKKLADLVSTGRKRLANLLKSLVNAGDLSKEAVLERLDLTIIQELDFIQDSRTFSRIEVRQRTALFYKQQKFNLLREESEGYAKLVVELLSNMGPTHDVVTAQSRETEQERTRRAISVNDKVKSLIGNFDLDPTRTLDIFLDTFSDQLVEHHQFFLDFLAVSPWAPKSRRDQASKAASDDKGKQKALPVDVGLDDEEGSDTIAQILGFKFGYYQTVDAGEVPQSLYLTAALLIWHGFVKLSDLWNHLSPSDADMSKIDAKYREEQAQLARSVGGANALAMAGALVDDETPSTTKTATGPAASSSKAASSASAPIAPPHDLPNQKIGLLKALLTLGDMTHSLFILAQWPILVHAFPEIADLLTRLLTVSIEPAYEPLSVSRMQHSQWADEFKAPKSRTILDAKGEKKILNPEIPRAITSEAFPDPKGEWTFFFTGWNERTPRAGDAEEVLIVLEKTFMPFLGIFISRDFSLFTKLCRIIKHDLTSDPNRTRESRWLDILRIHLLPSISLLHNHSVSSLEIWDVLSLFPIEKRFELYGEWKDVWYRKIPVLGVRKAEAEKDVKSILRRLSTENVKKLGKTLAKVAHTNPTVIWSVALNQVMSYDNLILPVIDAARYLTDLGYDVLAYCVLDALSGTRNKTKEDGTSVAMWLSGIASFTGQLYRRWAPMQSSLPVILQYLVNQLVSGNSKDLIVLRELISRMTAIEPFADLSDAQVLSLAGGRHLRNEVFQQTEIGQAGKRVQMTQLANARVRLQNSLLGDKDKSLAMPLLVNIALQRQACLKNTDAHLKSLGALFDQNHAILFQYTELLAALTEPDQLAKLLPSVPTLITTFHLSPSIAFDLARPKLRLAMRHHDEKEAAEQEARRKKGLLEKLQREKKVASASNSAKPASADAPAGGEGMKLDTVVVDGQDVKMEDVKVEDVKMEDLEAVANNALIETNGDETPRSATPSSGPPWHPGLVELVEKMNDILPEEARSGLGSAFFVTFWQMTLYDLHYPKERYDAEVSRLKGLQREAATNTSLQAADRDSFIAKIIDLATKLMAEMGRHFSASRGATRRLEKEKDHWFEKIESRNDRNRLVQDVLQYCVEPRARLSLPDAVFAYQMVKRLHSMNTAGFHTIVFFDQLLTSQVSPTLFSCTENEARNYGRFLYDVLSDLARWYKDEKAYKAEAVGDNLRGFARHFSPSSAKPTLEHYTHAETQKAITKWHASMLCGFQESFRSGGYMHIKNSILVLTKIAPYFPLDYAHGQHISHSVEELIAMEKREDLKILAQGYQAVIAKRKKHWANAPSAASSRAPSQPLVSASPTPAGSPAPTSAASKPAAVGRASIPAKPSTSDAASSSLPTGPSRATPTGPSSSITGKNAVPTGPKGLPVKPGQASTTSNRSTPAASSSATSDPTGSKGHSSTAAASSIPSGPANRSALPTRPGGGGPSARPSLAAARADSSSSSATTEKLRQQALASRQAVDQTVAPASTATTTAATPTNGKPMDPPPAPSLAGRSLSSRLDPSPRGGGGSGPGSRASSPRRGDESDRARRERTSDRDRDPRDGGGTESRTSRRSSRERERADRDKDKDKPRDRVRDRSVDSSHSSTTRRSGGGGDRGADDRDRRHDKERDRDSRGDRSERATREKDPRSSRNDRDRERDRERDKDDRGGSSRRTSDRYARDRGEGRSSSRRDKEEDTRRPIETPAARRLREADERAKAAREKEKERQRESDRVREEQRAKEKKDKRDSEDNGDKERRRSSGRRDESFSSSSSRTGLPPRPGPGSSSSGAPVSGTPPASAQAAKPVPTGPAVDRLRPAPALRGESTPSSPAGDSPARGPPTGPSGLPPRPVPKGPSAGSATPVAPPTGPAASRPSPVAAAAPPASSDTAAAGAPVNMIVKGRGRLYDSLVSDGGGASRRREDESGKKRAAPTGPLADRLGPEEKRARTDEGSIRGGRGSDPRDRRR